MSKWKDPHNKPPKPPVPNFAQVPPILTIRNQWVCWRWIWDNKGKRWTKPPYNAKNGNMADTTDPSTWSSFGESCHSFTVTNPPYDGIGFVFAPNDGLVGIDIDEVLCNGQLEPWSKEIVDRLSSAYCEISPSQNGLRCFCTGTLPPPLTNPAKHTTGKSGPDNRLELYDYTSPRYLTVTGHVWNGYGRLGNPQDGLDWLVSTYFVPKTETPKTENPNPTPPPHHSPPVDTLTDSELIEKASKANNGAIFTALWAGNTSGHGDDRSSADQALCNFLAFWTGNDASRMDSLFRQSGLMRDKWNSKRSNSTYGQMTIQKAIKMTNHTYTGKQTESGNTNTNNAEKKIPTRGIEKKTVSYHVTTWEEQDIYGDIIWDWVSWLPQGMLTLLASTPGIGKSALCLRIAGTYILGWSWPDGTPYTNEPGTVLWIEAESSQYINQDRAKKWGIPKSKMLDPLGGAPDAPPTTPNLESQSHRDAIHAATLRNDVRLVVVDSLRGVHRGDENSSKTFDVVSWLAELARDTGKPVLVTHHLRKKGEHDGDTVTLDQLRGSSAIVQPARVVWSLDAPIPTAPDDKRLSVIKSNIGNFPPPLGMMVTGEGITFGIAPEPPRNGTMLDKAKELLLSLLQIGPLPYNEVLTQGEEKGISKNTLYRAKNTLGVIAIKDGHVAKWGLPYR